jgi:hypothetical protein
MTPPFCLPVHSTLSVCSPVCVSLLILEADEANEITLLMV